MAFVVDDRVKETSTTTGTGTYDLAGAVTGFQTFVAGIGTGNTCWYSVTDGIDWEVGLGTVTDATPDTLARTTVVSSSNADAAVSWAAGTKTLVCTLPSYAYASSGGGKVFVSDASIGGSWSTKPAGYTQTKVITTTGTSWTKPTGLAYIIVEACGGGGGGAGSATSVGAGSGGGAGGYGRKTIAAASLAATETIIIGTGGSAGTTGGTAGGAGGSTLFGIFLTACGGAGGATGGGLAGAVGGVGGVATSGDINIQGGDGDGAGGLGTAVSGATASFNTRSGAGGASYFGGGGCGTMKSASGAAVAGTPGRAYGSGGGGGVGTSGSSGAGGAGKGGVVIIWEFV